MPSRKRFDRYAGWGRVLLVACWAVLAALAGALAIAPIPEDTPWIRAVGAVAAVAAAFVLVRSIRWGTIEAREDAVVIRGLFRQSTVSLDEIERFVVMRYRTIAGAHVVALGARTRDGQLRAFDDFAGDLGTELEPMKRLAGQLNEWLASNRTMLNSGAA